MNPTLRLPDSLRKTVKDLRTHWRVWAAATLLGAVGSAAYVLLVPPVWEASQALLVRDEAVGNLSRQGRFDSAEALKSAQETILQIAQHPHVVAAALAEVGPPRKHTPGAAWPSQQDVEQQQSAMAVVPPKGMEFGQTEVIYLQVRGDSRERAIRLSDTLCRHLEARLQALRDSKAGSVAAELQKQAHLARAELDAVTRRLQQMEAEVGSDLTELRVMTESGSGEGNLRLSLAQVENELRAAQAAHEASRQQRDLLLAAQHDPQQLLATPSRLLDAQPALKRLKEALVDAQVRTADMLGKMSPDHPLVQGALAAEQEIRQKLYKELESAVRGANAEVKLSEERVTALSQQATELKGRLDRLAGLRAPYANLVNEARRASETCAQADKALADARAAQAAAQSASLITRLGDPDTGDGPLGPGVLAILVGGTVGGWVIGVGLIVLLAPAQQLWGRRWTDQLRTGRRATDPVVVAPGTAPAHPGRRATDILPAGPPVVQPVGRRATDALPGDSLGMAPPLGERRSGHDRRRSASP